MKSGGDIPSTPAPGEQAYSYVDLFESLVPLARQLDGAPGFSQDERSLLDQIIGDADVGALGVYTSAEAEEARRQLDFDMQVINRTAADLGFDAEAREKFIGIIDTNRFRKFQQRYQPLVDYLVRGVQKCSCGGDAQGGVGFRVRQGYPAAKLSVVFTRPTAIQGADGQERLAFVQTTVALDAPELAEQLFARLKSKQKPRLSDGSPARFALELGGTDGKTLYILVSQLVTPDQLRFVGRFEISDATLQAFLQELIDGNDDSPGDTIDPLRFQLRDTKPPIST